MKLLFLPNIYFFKKYYITIQMFGVSRVGLFNKLILYSTRMHSKKDSKDFYIVTCAILKFCSFKFSIHQKILKNVSLFPQKKY